MLNWLGLDYMFTTCTIIFTKVFTHAWKSLFVTIYVHR